MAQFTVITTASTGIFTSMSSYMYCTDFKRHVNISPYKSTIHVKLLKYSVLLLVGGYCLIARFPDIWLKHEEIRGSMGLTVMSLLDGIMLT